MMNDELLALYDVQLRAEAEVADAELRRHLDAAARRAGGSDISTGDTP